MSNYKNYIKDFPKRCNDLLEHFFKDATQLDREVTLLMNVACAGFVIPFERLTPNPDELISTDICMAFDFAKRKFNGIQNKSFKHPQKGIGKGIEDIQIYEVKYDVLAEDDPGRWDKSPVEDANNIQVLSTFRNALAHGTIWMNKGNIIEDIWLVKKNPGEEKWKPTDGYIAVKTSPDSLKKLLKSWFDFLQEASDEHNGSCN